MLAGSQFGSNNGDETNSSTSSSSSPSNSLHLRWSRLTKTVSLSEDNKGLVKGSVGASMSSTKKGLKRDGGGGGGGLQSSESKRERETSAGMAAAAAATSLPSSSSSPPPPPPPPPPPGAPSTKIILNAISGSASPGEVLALMGPSGSGKTSLLNSLSGRTAYQSGILSINGIEPSPQAKKRLLTKIAYVKQADIFFSHLSVRDQLTYTALLRLPEDWPTESKLAEVDKILKMLRLAGVAESPIRLLSGGERKRTNIGTELLTDPSVLLLDEPTSGLDSTGAVALLQLLQNLAKQHRKTIITSIHQPSSRVFFSFDKLMMLAEGNVVFFGTPKQSLSYLRGINMACPDGYNAADHWMDLAVTSTADASSSFSSPSQGNRIAGYNVEDPFKPSSQLLIETWDNESVADQVDEDAKRHQEQQQKEQNVMHGTVVRVGDTKKKEAKISKYNTSWATQYRVLVHRALKNSKSAIFTPINMTKSAALGILAGFLYFQMPYTESSILDRNSFFFFAMTYWVFAAMFDSLMSFPAEREVILKERSSGAYHLSAYFMAKTTSELPMRMALPTIYMTISFWLAGVSPRFSLFLLTTLISLLAVIAGESIGLLVGASVYDMEKAMASMTVISLALMLLGGFFVQKIPSWLVWGKYLSPFKYSFDASRRLVFDRPVPCDGSGALEELCGGDGDREFATSEEVLRFLDVEGTVLFNSLCLLAIGLVPRYIAYLALRAKKEDNR